jgi:hypothetical protein
MWLYFAKCLQVQQPLWGRCKYQQNYACAFKWLSIFECICLKFRLSAPPDSKSKHGVFWGLGRVLWKISHPEPNTIFAILGKEREALGLSVSGRNLTGRWYGMRSSIFNSQDSWLPATDYPRASRSFPRIAGLRNYICWNYQPVKNRHKSAAG